MSDGVMLRFTRLRPLSCLRKKRFTSLMKLATTMSHLRTVQLVKSFGWILSVPVILRRISTGMVIHVSIFRQLIQGRSTNQHGSTGTSRYFEINNREKPEGHEKE